MFRLQNGGGGGLKDHFRLNQGIKEVVEAAELHKLFDGLGVKTSRSR